MKTKWIVQSKTNIAKVSKTKMPILNFAQLF
jgi:hypothetical protein